MAETLATPIPFAVILETIAAIAVISGIGVWLVKRKKV